eukprot:CAMPEP_0195036792 /NCGR_PEP_ID=MMETSP0326_2-20130528/73395_1 /TAXON_ID=2866 ORGANISM="Crypthecodinium cohnii, Strain Seligo" /NCGR_SAMPLE_ID=MMETSP0326_2 /ASSEMBLY_ACC=CAM_ASM_000348 /LENGTH=102 /DNA_ID=CAMNT_0040062527 /DNA_START=312 /DNA_END=616 /DNA_ORIENTATION=+
MQSLALCGLNSTRLVACMAVLLLTPALLSIIVMAVLSLRLSPQCMCKAHGRLRSSRIVSVLSQGLGTCNHSARVTHGVAFRPLNILSHLLWPPLPMCTRMSR